MDFPSLPAATPTVLSHVGSGAVVVFDVDGTVLHGSDALESGKALYQAVVRAGAQVVFITARPDSDEVMHRTHFDLVQAGLSEYRALFHRPAKGGVDVGIYKQMARQIVEKRYGPIAVCIGDAWHDVLDPVERAVTLHHLDAPSCYPGPSAVRLVSQERWLGVKLVLQKSSRSKKRR